MSDNKISLTYGMVGVSIGVENLLNRYFSEYESIFVMIDNNQHFDEKLMKIFPRGKYVCIRFNGIHKDTPPYYDKVLDYIKEQEYKILDASLEIELTDPSLSITEEEVVMELQILVGEDKEEN